MNLKSKLFKELQEQNPLEILPGEAMAAMQTKIHDFLWAFVIIMLGWLIMSIVFCF